MVGIFNDVIKTATRADSGHNRFAEPQQSRKQQAVKASKGFLRRFRGVRLSIYG